MPRLLSRRYIWIIVHEIQGAGLLKQFEILINNRPGELAKVTEALAASGINIMAIASERCENPLIRIVTDDEQSTRTALSKVNLKFVENELIVLELEDRPGELAKVAKRLSKSGINIESIHILSKGRKTSSVGLVTNNNKKAREILH
ncbi:MAG: ACT domain-containing protein [Thermoplasmata archaeon]|nr:ACT domain-containing protein [Thermoplasmata archaeon]